MDFGLLYENDEGEYVVLNDAWRTFAPLRLFTCLVYVSTFACLLHFCVETSRFDYSIWATPK